MGLFDNAFDIDGYVRKRLMEMDELKNRELFKEVIADMMVGLYHHVEEEYRFLENRVFREVPVAARMPDVVTGLETLSRYDVTDKYMRPMNPADLEQLEVVVADMLEAMKEKKPFFLYTCFIGEDYLELKRLAEEERIFHGILESEQGETAADFILRPNTAYRKQLEDLYPMSVVNRVPWRSVNVPYLHKLFDVYVVHIEEWDEDQQVSKITVEFEEFAEKVTHRVVPLWNADSVHIMANAYPQPAVERGYYEHCLFRSQFRQENDYLLKRADGILRGVRWLDGDLYILCDEDKPVDWEFFEFHRVPEKARYSFPLMSNAQNATFSLNMIEHYGQRIKTKTDLVRFLESFSYGERLEFVDAEVLPNRKQGETYSMEEFISYELRSGNWDRALLVSFRPKDTDFYLNRDIMSFLVTGLQHFFPEYECMGKLV